MKRIVSLMLVCVLSLTIIPQSNAVTQRELNEENATMYNTEMITYFEQEVGYPSHYGGAWLNQNSGHLVIGLTERNEEIEQYYYDVTGADILEFETVEYSLQELYDAMVETAENVSRTRSLPKVNGGAIMVTSNSVDIYVSENDAVSYISASEVTAIPQTVFYNIKSTDAIEFKIGGEMVAESALANVGEALFLPDLTGYAGSFGYIAYRYKNGVIERGFVTAGHTFHMDLTSEPEDTVLNSAGQTIGTVVLDMWRNPGVSELDSPIGALDKYGMRDYVFVKFNNGVSLNPQIEYDALYSQDLGIRYIIPLAGNIVHKSGRATGHTSDEVVSVYYYSSNDFSRQPSDSPTPEVRRILCLYDSAKGDSGGIVYTRRTNHKAGVVGIHQGSGEINGVNYSLVLPAYNIQDPSRWRNEPPDMDTYEETLQEEYVYAGE